MIMSSIVWSNSKDLLHLAALNIHLVVGKFQGKNKIFVLLILKQVKILFLPSLICIAINRVCGCYCDSSKHDIYILSFSITLMNNNPHIAIGESLFLLYGWHWESWAIMCWGKLSHNIVCFVQWNYQNVHSW